MVLVLICPCTSRAFLRFFPRDVARGACSKGRARHYLDNAAPTAMIQCPKFLGPAIAPCRAGWGTPVVAHSFDHPLGSSWLVNKSDPSLEQFHRLGSIDVVKVDAPCCLQPNNHEQEPSRVASNRSCFYVCFQCSKLICGGWSHVGSTIVIASCSMPVCCARHVTSRQKLDYVVLSRLILASPFLGEGRSMYGIMPDTKLRWYCGTMSCYYQYYKVHVNVLAQAQP